MKIGSRTNALQFDQEKENSFKARNKVIEILERVFNMKEEAKERKSRIKNYIWDTSRLFQRARKECTIGNRKDCTNEIRKEPIIPKAKQRSFKFAGNL